MAKRARSAPMNFAAMPQASVPQGRNGKHKAIVTKIVSDLDQVGFGKAIRVPLADLRDTTTKEQVRSAVNRASRKAGRVIATASDETYLYLWNEPPAASPTTRTQDAGGRRPRR